MSDVDLAAERAFKQDYLKFCGGNLPGPSSLFEHGFKYGAKWSEVNVIIDNQSESERRLKAAMELIQKIKDGVTIRVNGCHTMQPGEIRLAIRAFVKERK